MQFFDKDDDNENDALWESALGAIRKLPHMKAVDWKQVEFGGWDTIMFPIKVKDIIGVFG
jgi:hypothetical protein